MRSCTHVPCSQELRHPLLGSLMQCLSALLKDHKADLESILVVDKQVSVWGVGVGVVAFMWWPRLGTH